MAKPLKRPTRPYRLHLVIPDPHIPREAKRAFSALEKYAADEHWDGWVCLGDLLDNDSISGHNTGKHLTIAKSFTVWEQFDHANRFLDRHLAAVRTRNPKCALTLIEGNHEDRLSRFIDGTPQLHGLTVEKELRLKDRGVNYVRFWSRGELHRIGKLYVGHGAYCGQGHAAKHVRDFGVNLLYGHTHDVQAFSISRRSSNTAIMAQSCGCMCEYDQPYMQGRPCNWVNAFGVVWELPGGYFQHTVVPIFNGRFVGPTTGKLYTA